MNRPRLRLHLCLGCLSLSLALFPLLVWGLGENYFNLLSLQLLAIHVSQCLERQINKEMNK